MRLAIGWASPAPGSELRTAIRVAEDRLNGDRRRAVPAEDGPPADDADDPQSAPLDAYQAGSGGGIDLTPPRGDDTPA
jgi:hypothetical protein